MSFIDTIGNVVSGIGNFFQRDSLGSNLAKSALLAFTYNRINRSISNSRPDLPSSSSTPSTPRVERGTQVQVNPDTTYSVPVLYGDSYITGAVTDAFMTTDNSTMWFCITICEKTGFLLDGNESVISFEEIYWDGFTINFQSNGYVVNSYSDEFGGTSTEWDGLIEIYPFSGNSESPVSFKGEASGNSQYAYNLMPNWTQDHQMSDLVFCLVKMTYNSSKNLTRLGNIKFKMSNSMKSPGDVLFDYMTNTRYGAGIPLNQINAEPVSVIQPNLKFGISNMISSFDISAKPKDIEIEGSANLVSTFVQTTIPTEDVVVNMVVSASLETTVDGVGVPFETEPFALTGSNGIVNDQNIFAVLNSGNISVYDLTQSSPFNSPTYSIANTGTVIAINDNYLVVGNPSYDLPAANAGQVKVYNLNNGNLLYTFNNPEEPASDSILSGFEFGYSVALHNDKLVISAPGYFDYTVSPSQIQRNAGRVYMYDLTTGSRIRTFDNLDIFEGSGEIYDDTYFSGGDRFGSSVDINENYVLIGANGENQEGENNSGVAYLLDHNGVLQHTFIPTILEGLFGSSVKLDSSFILIGEGYLNLFTSVYDSQTFNFLRSHSGSPADSNINSYAIGNQRADGTFGQGSGKVVIFDKTTGNELFVLENANDFGLTDYDNFGARISMNNNYLIVTATGEDAPGQYNVGRVYVYNLQGGN